MDQKIALTWKLMRDREMPIAEVRDAVGVSRATLYHDLKPDGTPREALGTGRALTISKRGVVNNWPFHDAP